MRRRALMMAIVMAMTALTGALADVAEAPGLVVVGEAPVVAAPAENAAVELETEAPGLVVGEALGVVGEAPAENAAVELETEAPGLVVVGEAPVVAAPAENAAVEPETEAPGLVVVGEAPVAAGPAENAAVEPEAEAPGLVVEEAPVVAAPAENAAVELETEALPMPNDVDFPAEAPTPHVDPLGPQLTSNALTLGVGEAFDLAPAMPAGRECPISCVCSDPAVATATAAGVVTAVAPGEACVTAIASDGTYAECFVQVKKAPDVVRFPAKSFSIGLGEATDALRARVGSVEGEFAGACAYATSDAGVVAVDPTGVMTGVALGKAVVTATAYNGLSASIRVTVAKAPGKVTAKIERDVLGVGDSVQVKATLPKKTGGVVRFDSDDPAVAVADPLTGVVEGVAPGETLIRASTYNGRSAAVAVRVLPAPQALAFPQASVRLGVGMKLPFAASVDEGAADVIAYAIEGEGRAQYAGGVLKGVAKGKAALVATTYNGLTARCEITVVSAPKKVALPSDRLTIGVGQVFRLQPDVGKSASTFTYSTSDKKTVAVNGDGFIKGVKKGSATVTVRTYNGKTFKLKVSVLKAPGAVRISPKSAELGVGETLLFTGELPKGTAGAVTYASDAPAVASVDAATGQVTAVAPGSATVTATTQNGKTDSATVTVLPAPEWIAVDTELIELGAGMTHALQVTLSPGSKSALRFTSANPKVASVSPEGVVTGVRKGATVVSVETAVASVRREVAVTVLPAPKKVTLTPKKRTLNVGETTQLTPVIAEGRMAAFTFLSSDTDVATVSAEGMVTAVGRGKATLTARAHNGRQATVALTVLDPWFPERIEILNAPDTMQAGSMLQLMLSVAPESALPELEWTSSDEAVAYVDESNVIHATRFGYAVLTATSRRNREIALEIRLAVQSEEVVLAIPARITDIAGIPENLEMIEAIHACAVRQIGQLYFGDVISKSDAEKRKSIVDNAFRDYAFPWMTPKLQKYWKAENSEGGAKDFKPNQVYYGLPYISGSGTNRQYNAAKALNEGRFTDSGQGYYLLNQGKLLNNKYCGNDCSCFVDAAIWGTASGHSADRTADIAVSSAYRTISDFGNMRTGDLICKGYAHVVMFLYYANADKTKIMIIENGGSEPATNTVHCIVMNTKSYASNGYKVRRLASLG